MIAKHDARLRHASTKMPIRVGDLLMKESTSETYTLDSWEFFAQNGTATLYCIRSGRKRRERFGPQAFGLEVYDAGAK